MIIVLFVSLSIAGCGGKAKEPEVVEKGTLNRTFKLIDDSGRESGTLTLNAVGGAELRDADGNLIGTFISGNASESVVEKASEASVEKKSSDKDKNTE
nr:hypothetical protein [uncultured Desulfobacter sp.]